MVEVVDVVLLPVIVWVEEGDADVICVEGAVVGVTVSVD